MKYTQVLMLVSVVLTLLSASGIAATCGNNNAEGNEECDGSDLRGYSCYNIRYFDKDHPKDYGSDYTQHNDYSYYDSGTLGCGSDCTFATGGCYVIICGDGVVHGMEECDDGDQNSDTKADACRNDCTLPSCGDWVEDSGEECDEGSANSDEIPNQCRTDCREAHCGDGVIDPYWGEECDEGDYNANDGCYRCMRCYKPYDNLHIAGDAKLCSGDYTLQDGGEEGVIIVDGDGITLNCNGATLEGVPSELLHQATTDIQPNTAFMQSTNTQSQSNTAESSGFFSQVFDAIVQFFSGSPASTEDTSSTIDDTSNNNPAQANNPAVSWRSGTGIYIKGDNVLLTNCGVTNYRNGVKLTSSGSILANNRLCGNTNDIKASSYSNHGAKNRCNSAVNWKENGVSGCTFNCNDELNAESDCPACVCECPPCEVGEEPAEEEPEMMLCPDGSYAGTLEDCPATAGCPGNQISCPDGTCVDDVSECASEQEEDYVCCMIRSKSAAGAATSEYYDLTSRECEEKGGREVEDRYCSEQEEDVCCMVRVRSPTGAVTLEYHNLTGRECEMKGGKEVEDRYCSEQEEDVCCMLRVRSPTGAVTYEYHNLTGKKCEEKGGKEVEDKYCGG